MRKFVSRLGFALIVLFLIFGCDKKIGEYLLGDLKKQNPYTGNETLIFLDANGDSLVLYGTGRYTYTQENEYHDDPQGYYVNEYDECTFMESRNDFELKIAMGTHKSAAFTMSFSFKKSFDDGKYCTCYSKGGGYFAPLVNYYSHPDKFMDSLKVLNTIYYDVIADSAMWTSSNMEQGECTRFVSPIFYTIENGFIRIDFTDGKSYGLSRIISK